MTLADYVLISTVQYLIRQTRGSLRPARSTEQAANKGHEPSVIHYSLTITHSSLTEEGNAVLHLLLYRRIVAPWSYHPSGFVKCWSSISAHALPQHRIVCLGHLH